jgi:hypothetical protein
MISAISIVVLSVIVVGITLSVYRDSDRLGMERPVRWAGVVFVSTGAGAGLILLTDIPAAGVLAMAIIGPVVYFFERDDVVHGEGSPDEFTLEYDSNGTDSENETTDDG